MAFKRPFPPEPYAWRAGTAETQASYTLMTAMTNNATQTRRSERIMLTVPLAASGVNAEGQPFNCPARTVSVNRYGARIQLSQSVVAGQTIELRNLVNQLSCSFRVVAQVGEDAHGAKQWGVETLNPELDFWGIYFPPKSPDQPESTALLECCGCHTLGLLPLSLPEVETLDAGGKVSRLCSGCGIEKDWSYPDKSGLDLLPSRVPEAEPLPGVASISRPSAANAPETRTVSATLPAAAASPAETRQDRRRYVRRSITIRDSTGRSDSTVTENLSKSGVCLTSELDYASGQEVTLVWPHPVTGQRYEARARIVRRHDLGGTARKIYGLEYLSGPVLVAAQPLNPRGLYWKLAVLIAAAAAAWAMAAFRLGMTLVVPMNTWQPALELLMATLLLYLAHRTWRHLQERESRNPARRMLHRTAASLLVVAVLAGAIGAGALTGYRNGTQRANTLRLINDLSVSDSIEQSADQSETLELGTVSDYAAASNRLEILSRQWAQALNRVSADVGALNAEAGMDGPSKSQLSTLDELLKLDREKLNLLNEQAGLAAAAGLLPANERLAFWQSHFEALRRRIGQINRKRHRLVKSLAP